MKLRGNEFSFFIRKFYACNLHILSIKFSGSFPQIDFDNFDNVEVGLAPLPDGKVTCLKCGKTLYNAVSGKRHYASRHQPNEPMECTICNKMLKNLQARNQHLRQMHGITTAMMKNEILPPPTTTPPSTETDLVENDLIKKEKEIPT